MRLNEHLEQQFLLEGNTHYDQPDIRILCGPIIAMHADIIMHRKKQYIHTIYICIYYNIKRYKYIMINVCEN